MSGFKAIEVSSFVLRKYDFLKDFINEVTKLKGGLDLFGACDVQIFEINNFNGFSGYNYWINDKMIAQLHLASAKSGQFIIFKSVYLEDQFSETYSVYDEHGEFQTEQDFLKEDFISYKNTPCDLHSPIINHLYNVLNFQYQDEQIANSNTDQISTIQYILRSLAINKDIKLSASTPTKDVTINRFNQYLLTLEKDKVLTYEEKAKKRSDLLSSRSQIIKLKKRAHNFSLFEYDIPLFFQRMLIQIKAFFLNFGSNTKGLLYKNTIGHLIWFCKSVKDNLGYSIALAIYGPFTYYFITQPMNPHAMNMVGKVRNQYIEIKKDVSSILNSNILDSNNKHIDKVSTKLAAPAKKAYPKNSDHKWQERMSQFKAMNIEYEADMIFAERIGRLEQVETQLNLPYAMMATWREILSYKRSLELKAETNTDEGLKSFIANELSRIQQDQLYIFDKSLQVLKDYPYIVGDTDGEQVGKTAYTFAFFNFIENMQEKLGSFYDKKVEEHIATNLEKGSQAYKRIKKNHNSILKTLEKNSFLFQNDQYDSDLLRKKMKRHWEIIFLQQNKKQEAASFGVQNYYASIKNAIWSLQTIYSIRNDEISFEVGQALRKSNQLMLENLLYFITYDYVSIKKEIAHFLKGDTETTQREQLIDRLKSYYKDRQNIKGL